MNYLTGLLKDRLVKEGIEVDTYELDPLNLERLDYSGYDLLGIGYPIYGFSVPGFLQALEYEKDLVSAPDIRSDDQDAVSGIKKYIEETNILNRYTGNLVHDHETVIYNYGNKHIECNVHVSRYLKGCYESTKNKWALKMRSFLCSLNEYRKLLIKKDITKIGCFY